MAPRRARRDWCSASPRPGWWGSRSWRSGRWPIAAGPRATPGFRVHRPARGHRTLPDTDPWRSPPLPWGCPSRRRGGGDLLSDPVVAFALELERQLLAARLDDAPVEEDMDVVRRDVLENPLVVRHQDHGVVGAAEAVHTPGHDPERVDVR